VTSLSETWGVERDADGCTVWCQLAVDDASANGSGHQQAISRTSGDGRVR